MEGVQFIQKDVLPLIWDFIVENNMNKDGDEDDKVEDADYNPPIVSPGILKSGNEEEVKNTTDDELFPIVLRAYGGKDGFDGTNPSVKKWMHKLLSELNSLLSTTYQLNFNGLSNNKISYVRADTYRRA